MDIENESVIQKIHSTVSKTPGSTKQELEKIFNINNRSVFETKTHRTKTFCLTSSSKMLVSHDFGQKSEQSESRENEK